MITITPVSQASAARQIERISPLEEPSTPLSDRGVGRKPSILPPRALARTMSSETLATIEELEQAGSDEMADALFGYTKDPG